MKKSVKPLLTTREMSTAAILAALASVLFLLEIPVVLFHKLDFSNLPVLLGTFSMGPLVGTLILAVKSLIGLLHSSSQGVGELADFLVGLAMVLPAGLIYRHRKSKGGAILGMCVGSIAAVVVGVLANVYILIPFYGTAFNLPIEKIIAMGQTVVPSMGSVWEFVFYITTPFNLLKWVVISILGALMYKPLSPLLHGRARASAPSRQRKDQQSA